MINILFSKADCDKNHKKWAEEFSDISYAQKHVLSLGLEIKV